MGSNYRGGKDLLAAIRYVSPEVDLVDISHTDKHLPFPISTQTLPVRVMRAISPPTSLDWEGCAFAHWPSAVARDWRDELTRENAMHREDMPPVNRDYIAELIPLIEAMATGACEIIAQHGSI